MKKEAKRSEQKNCLDLFFPSFFFWSDSHVAYFHKSTPVYRVLPLSSSASLFTPVFLKNASSRGPECKCSSVIYLSQIAWPLRD